MTAPFERRLRVSDADDIECAAGALAAGSFVVHPFGNIYALSTRADVGTVREVNAFKGRPPGQIGSMTTTPSRIGALFDLSRLPSALRPDDVLGLMDQLLCMGPFGFRGPAADHLPDHLTARDRAGRWAQVIVPGYRCPGNAFLTRCLHLCRSDYLHCTSANPSRHLTGAPEEPVHYRADPLRAALKDDARLVVLEHDDEDAVLRAYPRHAPMSTTVLAFGALGVPDGYAVVRLERHGSLPVDEVRSVVDRYGIELHVPADQPRLPQRVYR